MSESALLLRPESLLPPVGRVESCRGPPLQTPILLFTLHKRIKAPFKTHKNSRNRETHREGVMYSHVTIKTAGFFF